MMHALVRACAALGWAVTMAAAGESCADYSGTTCASCLNSGAAIFGCYY